MSKLVHLVVMVMIMTVACSKFDDSAIWEKLNDHENRIVYLEEVCRKMNADIVNLQTIVTALESNDNIVSVSPLATGDGYTFTFSSGKSIVIYSGVNGQDGTDGKNGVDGKDGVTPVISVMKDTDGVYYWTVNGEWLLVNGNKIKASAEDGEDGTDGITPQFKIEDDYWYVSYDNGVSWQQLGSASVPCDCTNGITSISQDENYVHFVLDDGSVISVPKNNVSTNGNNSNIITFECPYVKAICIRNWDTDSDGELSFDEAAAVTSLNGEFSNIEYLTMTYATVNWNSQVIALGNHSILSFEELKYFTSLVKLNNDDFSYDINLYKIAFPESLTTIETRGSIVIKDVCENRGFASKTIYYDALTECPLQSVTLLSSEPIGNSPFFPVNDYCKIFVPADALESYKTAWADYADHIYSK